MQYQIIGDSLPAVICNVAPGETLITESGSMAWMSPNMKMETSAGGLGKAFGRLFSGESIFLNRYTAMGGPGQITFASSFPGSIKAFEIGPGKEMIVQKCGFLAAEAGVELSVYFQRRVGTGLFGGEGFVMQRLSGRGIAFIEIDGHAVEYYLAAGQSMIVDTGYLAAMEATCTMEVTAVPGFKNVLFGGEGVFHTVVKGPGRIILQTLPIMKVAGVLRPYFPTSND